MTRLSPSCAPSWRKKPSTWTAPGQWPAKQLQLCGERGVFEWFIDPAWGGQAWSEEDVVRGYLALSAACLTTTFIMTQRTGACRRIAGCQNEGLKQRLLPGLARGDSFATVGISHLTTSRRHLARPVLTAETIPGGFRLDGMSPWVTGGAAADVIVMAAILIERGEPTDKQLLIAVPTDTPGVSVADPLPLIGVSASSTGPVHLKGVELTDDWLIAGPLPNVMSSGLGASTGGYETSTLAIGSGRGRHRLFVGGSEQTPRPVGSDRLPSVPNIHRFLMICCTSSAAMPPAPKNPFASERIAWPYGRHRQRSPPRKVPVTSSATPPAAGAARRLFFLVWSCPQPVAAANLCELAGIAYE